MSKRHPSSTETKAYTATVASNKDLAAAAAASDSDYSTCHASLHGCVFDQEFVPHTPGNVLDSGAQVNILEGTLGSGTRIQLTSITGATTEAERADAMFPVLAADGSRHTISIRGKNIVATPTTDNSGPQHSLRRLLVSGQVQCTSWRNFAPFSSSTFKNIHGEQAGKRDRGGSAVGARYIERGHDTTQPALNKDIKRAQVVCPWSPSQKGARGQGSSACRAGEKLARSITSPSQL
jgi:hypothetical protein